MNEESLANLKPYQIVGLAVILSAAAALAVAFLLRRGRSRDESPAARVPPQPAVSTNSEPGVPQHFTEDLVVPGFTETGAEVSQEDETDGRSPEGA